MSGGVMYGAISGMAAAWHQISIGSISGSKEHQHRNMWRISKHQWQREKRAIAYGVSKQRWRSVAKSIWRSSAAKWRGGSGIRRSGVSIIVAAIQHRCTRWQMALAAAGKQCSNAKNRQYRLMSVNMFLHYLVVITDAIVLSPLYQYGPLFSSLSSPSNRAHVVTRALAQHTAGARGARALALSSRNAPRRAR